MMRQLQAMTTATTLSLIVLAVLTFLPQVGLGSPPAHASPLRQAPGASPRTVAASKVAAPGVIGLGEVAGNFVDHLGRSGVLTFTVPSLIVQQVTSTPTPTAPPATATPTPGPTRNVHPTQVRPTQRPTTGPTPTPTPAVPQLCPDLAARVPAAVINQAMVDPASVNGWGERCNPSQPPGVWNGPRTRLALRNNGIAYHPLYNSVEWQCGCR